MCSFILCLTFLSWFSFVTLNPPKIGGTPLSSSSLLLLLLCVPEPGTAMDRQVLAQLTQLYMTVKLECPFYGVKTHRFYWPVDGYTAI